MEIGSSDYHETAMLKVVVSKIRRLGRYSFGRRTNLIFGSAQFWVRIVDI